MMKETRKANGEPWSRVSTRTSDGKLKVCGWLNMKSGLFESDNGEIQRTCGYDEKELEKIVLGIRLYLRVDGEYFHSAGYREKETGRIVWEKERGPRGYGLINHRCF